MSIEASAKPSVLASIAPRLTVGEHDDGRIAIAFDVVVPESPPLIGEPLIVRQELLLEEPEASFLCRALGALLSQRGLQPSALSPQPEKTP